MRCGREPDFLLNFRLEATAFGFFFVEEWSRYGFFILRLVNDAWWREFCLARLARDYDIDAPYITLSFSDLPSELVRYA